MAVKQKVLIVDDEPRNQRIITETLDGLFDLHIASSGEAALTSAQQVPPDLILLDIMMPHMDGYEVCSRIRNNPDFKFTKIILVSGKALVDERLKGYAAGADDYMTKPFVPEELLAKTKVFLRLTEAEKELHEINQSLDAKVQEKARLLLEAEIKLMNSAKMSALGEMAGGLAHEINTPLATILLATEQQLELIVEGALAKDSIQGALHIIASASNHIVQIVQSLRFFSRDSGGDPFNKADLSKIVADTVLLCRERFRLHSIQLQIEAPSCIVNCRPVQIAQVLLNLLNNSFHAVEKHSERWIKVSLQDHGETVEISVTDSGISIPKAVREKLFQPFFTTKEVGKGTGLGLGLSKGIAENHGGTLILDELSKETRFVVQIPKEQKVKAVAI